MLTIRAILERNVRIEADYSTVIRFLREQNYRLKVPQPWPDRQDESLRQTFHQKLRELLSDPEVDLWFADETGIEGGPRPRRRWARRGEKCRVTKNGDHLWMNVTGMVCPRTGEFYALEFTHSDGTTFQAFLDEANKEKTCNGDASKLFICRPIRRISILSSACGS